MNEIVKYITEQFVTYMNLTVEERKKRKKISPRHNVYTNKWLGVLPFALKTIWKKAE